jgi:signal peptidase II
MEKAKAGATGLLPGVREHTLFWGIAAAGVGLDLWSKHAVFAWMKSRGIWEYKLIDGFLSLVMRENPGAAFGIAEGQRVILVVCAVAAMAAITGYFLLGHVRDRMVCAALGLFLGGVIGNFYDRIFNGGLVRDFIDVYWRTSHWPAFNVADSMLCIAVGVLLVRTFFTARPS